MIVLRLVLITCSLLAYGLDMVAGGLHGATSYSDRLDLGQSRHDTHLDCVGLRLSTSPQNRMSRGRVIMPKNTITGFAPCMGCTMYSGWGNGYTVPSETRFTSHIESICMDCYACLQAG